jgi:hypothetical protein
MMMNIDTSINSVMSFSLKFLSQGLSSKISIIFSDLSHGSNYKEVVIEKNKIMHFAALSIF